MNQVLFIKRKKYSSWFSLTNWRAITKTSSTPVIAIRTSSVELTSSSCALISVTPVIMPAVTSTRVLWRLYTAWYPETVTPSPVITVRTSSVELTSSPCSCISSLPIIVPTVACTRRSWCSWAFWWPIAITAPQQAQRIWTSNVVHSASSCFVVAFPPVISPAVCRAMQRANGPLQCHHEYYRQQHFWNHSVFQLNIEKTSSYFVVNLCNIERPRLY